VKYEISPEPTPEQRNALTQALERLLAGQDVREPSAYTSRWRLEALRENVEDE
jgi:hypothetical protein